VEVKGCTHEELLKEIAIEISKANTPSTSESPILELLEEI
jgi:hypothetical protein